MFDLPTYNNVAALHCSTDLPKNCLKIYWRTGFLFQEYDSRRMMDELEQDKSAEAIFATFHVRQNL